MPSIESPPTATSSPDELPPSAIIDDEEEELRTRLRHRRLEIDHEIAEFKERKEAEYARFETSLRAEATARREAAKQAAAGRGTVTTEPGDQIPINLGHSLLEDQLRDTLSHTDQHRSPPFEKELQVAGLFAPCYLPLLEDRRDAPQMPPPPSPTKDSGSSSRNSSPTAPLASSLKSSSYLDSPNGRKPKSPKRVTFQFEDEASVPSRSSPPAARVTWNFGAIDDVEEGEYDEEGEDEEDTEEMFIEDVRDVEGHAEDVTASFSSSGSGSGHMGDFSRHQGDELVTPTSLDNDKAADAVPASSSTQSQSWTSQLDCSAANGYTPPVDDDDDDDEALFDLDEMVPESSPQTPPHRDYSPLIEAQLAAQQLPPETGDFHLPSASYAARIPLPGSFIPAAADPLKLGRSSMPAAGDSMQFGKYPIPTRASFLRTSSPLTASSVPTTTTWGGFTTTTSNTTTSNTATPEDTSRFRRRTINKYIPSPPPEEDTDTASTSSSSKAPSFSSSVFATSLPMSITSRLRAPLPIEEYPPSPVQDSLPLPQMANILSPYQGSFAKELMAQQTLLRDTETQGVGESIVGGVDGRTGLDPGSFSVRGAQGLLSPQGNPVWSLSARMAVEEQMERAGGSSLRG
jgi:hypothetical protein